MGDSLNELFNMQFLQVIKRDTKCDHIVFKLFSRKPYSCVTCLQAQNISRHMTEQLSSYNLYGVESPDSFYLQVFILQILKTTQV